MEMNTTATNGGGHSNHITPDIPTILSNATNNATAPPSSSSLLRAANNYSVESEFNQEQENSGDIVKMLPKLYAIKTTYKPKNRNYSLIPKSKQNNVAQNPTKRKLEKPSVTNLTKPLCSDSKKKKGEITEKQKGDGKMELNEEKNTSIASNNNSNNNNSNRNTNGNGKEELKESKEIEFIDFDFKWEKKFCEKYQIREIKSPDTIMIIQCKNKKIFRQTKREYIELEGDFEKIIKNGRFVCLREDGKDICKFLVEFNIPYDEFTVYAFLRLIERSKKPFENIPYNPLVMLKILCEIELYNWDFESCLLKLTGHVLECGRKDSIQKIRYYEQLGKLKSEKNFDTERKDLIRNIISFIQQRYGFSPPFSQLLYPEKDKFWRKGYNEITDSRSDYGFVFLRPKDEEILQSSIDGGDFSVSCQFSKLSKTRFKLLIKVIYDYENNSAKKQISRFIDIEILQLDNCCKKLWKEVINFHGLKGPLIFTEDQDYFKKTITYDCFKSHPEGIDVFKVSIREEPSKARRFQIARNFNIPESEESSSEDESEEDSTQEEDINENDLQDGENLQDDDDDENDNIIANQNLIRNEDNGGNESNLHFLFNQYGNIDSHYASSSSPSPPQSPKVNYGGTIRLIGS